MDMASFVPQISTHNRYSYLKSTLFTPLLLTYLISQISAESPSSPTNSNSATSLAVPSAIASRTARGFLAAPSSNSVASQSIPSATDTANYAPDDDNNSPDKDVLNYYFLLLIALVLFVALMYWSLARRRHKRLLTSRSTQQSALAQDLNTWAGRRRGPGRWRFAMREPRVEEGLNERGEAPPPYLKEPEPAHHERRNEEMELHNMSGAEGKPPDYEEEHARR